MGQRIDGYMKKSDNAKLIKWSVVNRIELDLRTNSHKISANFRRIKFVALRGILNDLIIVPDFTANFTPDFTPLTIVLKHVFDFWRRYAARRQTSEKC